MKCQHCKSKENLCVNSTSPTGKIYYMCRNCNTERLINYRNTKKGKDNVFNAVYKSINKFREKQNARQLLNYHVRVGNTSKPNKCQCGSLKVEGHHEDYKKPLLVQWLCRSCHSDLHKGIILV